MTVSYGLQKRVMNCWDWDTVMEKIWEWHKN